jgi:hypothetical protein
LGNLYVKSQSPEYFCAKIVALFGMGGVGKTQVAIEYVITHKEKYKAVFWITATDRASLLLGFQEITLKTKCVSTEATDAISIAQEVLKWLENQRRWLLILDNIDDISVVHDCSIMGLGTQETPYISNEIPAKYLTAMAYVQLDHMGYTRIVRTLR